MGSNTTQAEKKWLKDFVLRNCYHISGAHLRNSVFFSFFFWYLPYYFLPAFYSTCLMDHSQTDLDSLIAQTKALSWEDPSSQLESLPEQVFEEYLPLVGHVISQKVHNNQAVYASLIKAWPFATPFSFAALGPNLFLFKFSK